MRSMVEGPLLSPKNPSTALRAVPLPRCVSLRSTSRGRIVLLRHNSWRHFRVKLRAQQGQRGSIRAIATTSLRCKVAIELGM